MSTWIISQQLKPPFKMSRKVTLEGFEGFPAAVKLCVHEDVIAMFYAESRREYKDKLFDLIEKFGLYHEWIDTCTYRTKGRYAIDGKIVESFRVCSRETWEQRKALYNTKNREEN